MRAILVKYDWMDQALCREIGPEIFHPPNGEYRQVQQAKAVCNKCPVIDKCLEYALTAPGVDGILAATTPKERATMRRRRREQEYAEERTKSLRNPSATRL